MNANSQAAGLRSVAEGINPTYKAKNDLVEFSNELDLTTT